MGLTARFQETLRRLAMTGEGFAEMRPALDPGTAAPLHVAVSAAIGSPAGCLEWSISRALAGVIEDEMADVLLAIAAVAGLSRVVCAAPMRQSRSGMTSRPGWRNRTIIGNSGLSGRSRRRSGHDCED